MRYIVYRLDGAVQVGALLDGDVVLPLGEVNESGSVRAVRHGYTTWATDTAIPGLSAEGI
jgi:hypothetical protein